MRSIGIDIGKKKCVICIMDASGKILEETSYDNTKKDAERFAKRVKKKYRRCQAACESTRTMWLKSVSAFEKAKIPIKVANTRKMKIISDMDKKTDPVDARKIANALRLEQIPECHIASPKTRALRGLLRYRIFVVQRRTRDINALRDILRIHDEDVSGAVYATKNLKALSEIKLDDLLENMVMQNLVDSIKYNTENIGKIEDEIRRQAAASDDARILMSMTGIDSFAAMLVASEIDGIKRFRTAKELVSWAGMCPTVHQSGDTMYLGRMKKDGNRRVNWVMIQAAWVAAGSNDQRLKAYYERCKARSGGKSVIAATHLANKMLRIIWAMLTNRTLYSTHDKDSYRRKLTKVDKAASS